MKEKSWLSKPTVHGVVILGGLIELKILMHWYGI